MEIHPSSFDSSEMVGAFLGTTPLLVQSWEVCSRASQSGFLLVECQGDRVIVGFPGRSEVDLSRGVIGHEQGPFSPLTCHVGFDRDDESHVIMVGEEFLRLFLDQYNQPSFKEQMQTLANESKSIVITGHSIGATTASLTALWLLCRSIASPHQVLCITFGSPLLGNGSLSLAILQERWGGNFCHVVSKHDIIPILYLAPLSSVSSPVQLHAQDRQWDLDKLFQTILFHTAGAATTGGSEHRMFWPFGSFIFCSGAGAICMDNAESVLKMMHLMIRDCSPRDGIQDHLSYGDIASILYSQNPKIRNSNGDDFSESSYESSVSFALQSIGMNPQDTNATPARTCLQTARQMGLTPVLNAAELAVKLGRIHPCMAQLEWYKKRCEEEYRTGYYDTFKEGRSMRRESTVDMNLYKLGAFWDKVITMVERNQVPQDFIWRLKWKYAPHTYMLLAEPLEIARYYRPEKHVHKGHYIEFGRQKRFRVFEKWWQRNTAGKELSQRNNFASLTQDPVFWARVEEARERLKDTRQERDPCRLASLLEGLNGFEEYAAGMIERKEVSQDVLLQNSSYTQWTVDWNASKSRFREFLGMTN